MADVVMPRLSDTMEEGTILRWFKHDGEAVRRGEELVEIETDKATMSYESDLQGVLETVAQEGDTLAVGALIARVAAEGEAPTPASPSRGGSAADTAAATDAAADATPDGRTHMHREPAAGAPAAAPTPGAGRLKASPLARRIALASGVDLRALTGSGPGGRIVAADVQGAAPRSADVTAAGRPEGDPAVKDASARAPDAAHVRPDVGDVVTAKGETTIVELSRTQHTIARRMAESKATIPDFMIQMEVDMEQCAALRAELKRLAQPSARASPQEPGSSTTTRNTVVPTYNDMVVKACALALRQHPRVNGSYRDGSLQLHSRVNVGVAVAVSDALVVPTVFDADEKSLGEIAREARALAERVRSATITPPELSGGTFTVSNLGMYGVRSFTAIINPPQAAILSVGSVERRAVVREGELVARHAMTLTLACDHRMLYGADAASFLARIRELLERPAALTL